MAFIFLSSSSHMPIPKPAMNLTLKRKEQPPRPILKSVKANAEPKKIASRTYMLAIYQHNLPRVITLLRITALYEANIYILAMIPTHTLPDHYLISSDAYKFYYVLRILSI